MYDGIKLFLEWVGYFFIAYLIGYSTFLFLSVVVGSLELYKHRRQEMLKSILPSDYSLPIRIIVPAYNEEVTVADTVRSLLALDYRSYEIIVVDEIKLAEPKTKLMAKVLGNFDLKGWTMLVLPGRDETLVRASGNIEKLQTSYVNTLNVYDILKAGKIILTKDALKGVEEVYA